MERDGQQKHCLVLSALPRLRAAPPPVPRLRKWMLEGEGASAVERQVGGCEG